MTWTSVRRKGIIDKIKMKCGAALRLKETYMSKLIMVRYSGPVTEKALPEGYSFKLFDGTDADIDQWVELCRAALLNTATRSLFDSTMANYPGVVPETDCLFVVDPNGKYVTTSTYFCETPERGLVHMVASAPESRGKGLGHAILCEGVKMLQARGVKEIRLRTDDFRLAAIKTYLVGGFKPLIYDDKETNMEERWDKVLAELNYKVDYVYEK